MPADWARDVRDQCRDAGVPLFMKQMSRREPIPDDLLIREFPEG
jgi:protein gp37